MQLIGAPSALMRWSFGGRPGRSRLGGDERGAIAVLTALAMVPLIMVTALVLDMGFAQSAQRQWNSAADSAAVAAVNTGRIAISEGSGLTDAQIVAMMRDAGEAVFRASVPGFTGSVDVVPRIGAGRLSVDVTYRGQSLSLIPVLDRAVDVAGTASSSSMLAPFVDIDFMVDVSGSMGIGATKKSQDGMQQLLGCVFACHIGLPFVPSPYDQARQAGLQTRVDVVRDAVTRIMRHVDGDEALRQQVRFGLHTFSRNLQTVFTTDDPTVSSPGVAASKAEQGIALVRDGGGTNLHVALPKMSAKLGPSGDGSRPDKRQSYLILLTDGTEHRNNLLSGIWFAEYIPPTPTYGFLTQAFDPADCASIRAKGITLLILEVKYVLPEQNVLDIGHKDMVKHIEKNILPAMPDVLADCAGSSKNVYSANTPAEIDEAMTKMFKRVMTQTVLTR